MTTAGRNKGGNGEEQKAEQPAPENKPQTGSMGAGEEELAALRKDFERLREDVAALAEALRAAVQSGGPGAQSAAEEGEGVEAAADEADKWQELRDRFEQTREHGRDAIEDVETEVKRHPLASLAIAFGVGYLYARLTHLFR
ncbi:MAG: hypothetical protein D6720_00685 [Gammaproteobacteria bacterium]|nr:MAG: hypothetical protein D6720_00685 [Gammaproteobacteria bacterium]